MKFLLLLYILLITSYLSILIYQFSTLQSSAGRNKASDIMLIISVPLTVVGLILITMLYGV